MMRRLLLFVVVSIALLAPVVPTLAQDGTTVLDTIAANDQLNTLHSAIIAAGLVGELSGPGPYTIFAPTDDAFRALPTATLEALNSNPAALADLVRAHVIVGEAPADTPGGADASGALQASNGVVILIDAVLTPPPSAQVIAAAAESIPVDEIVLILGAAPIYIDPPTHGNQIIPSGSGLLLCQTAWISELRGNFAKLRDLPGWIPTNSFVFGSSGFGC